MRGRPRATLIRKHAAAKGWRRIEVHGVVRDICPHCARMEKNELGRCIYCAKPLEDVPPMIRKGGERGSAPNDMVIPPDLWGDDDDDDTWG